MKNYNVLQTCIVVVILFLFSFSAQAEIQFEWDKTIGEGLTPTGLVRADDGGYFISAMRRNDNHDVEYLALFRTDDTGDTVWTRRLEYYQNEHLSVSYPNDFLHRDASENLYLLNVNTSDQQHAISITKFTSDGDSLWRQDYAPEGAEEPWAEIISLRDSGFLLLVSYHYIEDDSTIYLQKLIKVGYDGNVTAENTIREYLGLNDITENEDGTITALHSMGYLYHFDAELNLIEIAELPWGTTHVTEFTSAAHDCYYVHYPVGMSSSRISLNAHNGEEISSVGCRAAIISFFDYSDRQVLLVEDLSLLELMDKDDSEIHYLVWMENCIIYKFLIDDEGITGIRHDGNMHLYHINRDQLDVSPVNTPIPSDFSIQDVYPNPFNSTTTIDYSLPVAGNLSLAVYDLSGREVTRLVDGLQSAGTHEAVWTADGVSSGVYVVRLTAGENILQKKVVLIK